VSKAKSGKKSPKKAPKEKTAAPASRNVVETADVVAKKAERTAAEAIAFAADKRAAAEVERRAFELDKRHQENVQRRLEADNATVKVMVQTKRERLVRLKRGFIASRTQVLVTRRELRRLQGMQQNGHIQLIVGELEEPGDLVGADGKPVEGE